MIGVSTCYCCHCRSRRMDGDAGFFGGMGRSAPTSNFSHSASDIFPIHKMSTTPTPPPSQATSLFGPSAVGRSSLFGPSPSSSSSDPLGGIGGTPSLGLFRGIGSTSTPSSSMFSAFGSTMPPTGGGTITMPTVIHHSAPGNMPLEPNRVTTHPSVPSKIGRYYRVKDSGRVMMCTKYTPGYLRTQALPGGSTIEVPVEAEYGMLNLRRTETYIYSEERVKRELVELDALPKELNGIPFPSETPPPSPKGKREGEEVEAASSSDDSSSSSSEEEFEGVSEDVILDRMEEIYNKQVAYVKKWERRIASKNKRLEYLRRKIHEARKERHSERRLQEERERPRKKGGAGK